MSTKVEAQGGELVIRNTHGDVVIIPRNKRREALGYLAKGDHSAIDAIAMELPKASDYAMGGAVYDGGEDPIEGVMGPETTIVGKRPFSVKNFLNRWGKHHAENPSDNFFGALGQGLMAPLQLAQAGATYALTGGKEIEPGAALRGSKFTNFMNKLSNSPTMDPISKAAASALGSETGQNILLDPLNIPITKGAQTFSKIKPLGITENIGSDLIRNGEYELVNTAKPIVSSVDDVGKQAPKQWQLEELPGLHLKSTMDDGAISKIIEPKTGLVNTEQAFAIIGKESGGKEKLEIIKKGFGDNIPSKMDYNEFRRKVQEQLIPLEQKFSTHASSYGIDRLYESPRLRKESVLENQTLILGNKNKFGRGSSAHDNPEETLGHIHFLRDVETPDVLTVTQIQSDAFQGTHRIMPKDSKNLTALEKQQKSLARMEELQERNKSILHKMKTEGLDEAGLPVQDYQIKQFEDIVKAQEQSNLFKKADIENFTQKQLLDKNHQERYLQELVDYAGKRGDVNKVRVPTSETAAKVQGYSKNTATGMDEMGLPTELGYSKEHQTILKKYSEQPKTIEKLFGVEPKIVTDSKGNTWYEFDIPKKFKEGKGEIKALTTVGATGTGVALFNQSKNKNEQ